MNFVFLWSVPILFSVLFFFLLLCIEGCSFRNHTSQEIIILYLKILYIGFETMLNIEWTSNFTEFVHKIQYGIIDQFSTCPFNARVVLGEMHMNQGKFFCFLHPKEQPTKFNWKLKSCDLNYVLILWFKLCLRMLKNIGHRFQIKFHHNAPPKYRMTGFSFHQLFNRLVSTIYFSIHGLSFVTIMYLIKSDFFCTELPCICA